MEYPGNGQAMKVVWSYPTPFSANPIAFVNFAATNSVNQMGAVEYTGVGSAVAYFENSMAPAGQPVTAYFFAIGI